MKGTKINETHGRYKDAQFYNPDLTVIILGAGGVSSHLSYVLSRQGYETYIYDFDLIEVHNIGSQLYSLKDLGKNKAEVAKAYAKEFGNEKYIAMGKFEEDSPIDNIVFSGFDNMKYRKIAFEKWLEFQKGKTKEYREANPNEVNCFMDFRMDAESWQVYMVKTLKEAERYRETLFDDSEVPDAPCSYKATCHTGTSVASYGATNFLNHVANKNLGFTLRKTFFKTFFDASSLRLEQYD